MVISLILALASVFGSNKELHVVKDLRSDWKVIQGGKFERFENQTTDIVHISLDLRKAGAFLQIYSKDNFYLFINSALVANGKRLLLNGDSLRSKYGERPFISIYQSKAITSVSTLLVEYKPIDAAANVLRPSKSFYHFIILATLILVIFFTALLRTNSQLTLDYLNVVKLFSFKQRDDSQFVLRITSSVNLLFYFFCSLLTALALQVAIHFSMEVSFSQIPQNQNVSGYFGQWILLSVAIECLLLLKLGLGALFSFLFGWNDTAGFQFFNFVRMLVVSLVLIGLVSIFCFSFEININYYFLIKCFCTMLCIGAILTFFKLMNRESTSAFHLFSYLCATEFFPLVILIKVFLF